MNSKRISMNPVNDRLTQNASDMSDVGYRRALPEDFAAILNLQSANYIANLSAHEREQGFLSAQFTPEQTAQIAKDLGTIVAVIDDQIVGFVCAFRNEFETGSPVIAKMLESYDRMIFEGRAKIVSQLYLRPRMPRARFPWSRPPARALPGAEERFGRPIRNRRCLRLAG
jgi:hypothetical protein